VCFPSRAGSFLAADSAVGSDSAAFAVARQTVREAFPPPGRQTQRAIISVGRRQFTCDGFLTASPAEGWHLALISMLGLVADVRVRNDGSTEVLKVTPLFREDWARDYVAQELRWLFTPPPELAPAGRLADGRLALEAKSGADGAKARYVCSADGSHWEEIEFGTGRAAFFTRRSPATGLSLAGRARCRVNSIWTRARINCKYGR